MRRITFVLSLICFLYSNSFAACPETPSECYTVVSCNQGESGVCRQPIDLTLAAVQATVDNSTSGDGTQYVDGVYLKSGSDTWASTSGKALYVNGKNGIVIYGNSSGTNITLDNGGSTQQSLISVNASDRLKISNITLNGDTESTTSTIKLTSSDNVTIEKCTFGISYYHIFIQNSGAGSVIHNNTFGAANSSILAWYDPSTDPNGRWNLPIDYGSNLWVFVENNTFNTGATSNPELIETGWGGKLVVRYNTINMNSSTGVGTVLDQHNNGIGNTGTSSGEYGRAIVFYNNLINYTAEYSGGQSRIYYFRGGTGVIKNNVINYSGRTVFTGILAQLHDYRAEGGPTHNMTETRDCATQAAANFNPDTTPPIQKCCTSSYGTGDKGEDYPCYMSIGAPPYTTFPTLSANHEPILVWGNRKTANNITYADIDDAAGSDPDTGFWIVYNDVRWAIEKDRDYCVSTSSISSCGEHSLNYSEYACPHPLTGLTVTCNSSEYGTSGYLGLKHSLTGGSLGGGGAMR